MDVTFKTVYGQSCVLTVNPGDRISTLKPKLLERWSRNGPLVLVFNAQIVPDDATVESAGFQADRAVYVAVGPNSNNKPQIEHLSVVQHKTCPANEL